MPIYRCTICGQTVSDIERPHHLVRHRADARNFSADEVEAHFTEPSYGYQEALEQFEQWGDLSSIFPAEQIAAIEKAKQALRDCLEMGLIGEGE